MTTYQQTHITHIGIQTTTTGKAVIVFEFSIRDLGALPVAPEKAESWGGVTAHGLGVIGDTSDSTSRLESLGFTFDGDAWLNVNPARDTQWNTVQSVGVRPASLRDRDEVAAAWMYLETWARRQNQCYVLASYVGWVLDQLFLVGAIDTITQFEFERRLKTGIGISAVNEINALIDANESKPITDFE
jgi:hypothetical protein